MTDNPFDKLTAREVVVAQFLCDGASMTQIAAEMSIAGKTVDTHRGHVMKKIGALNNVQLLRMAIYWGFVPMPPTAPPALLVPESTPPVDTGWVAP